MASSTLRVTLRFGRGSVSSRNGRLPSNAARKNLMKSRENFAKTCSVLLFALYACIALRFSAASLYVAFDAPVPGRVIDGCSAAGTAGESSRHASEERRSVIDPDRHPAQTVAQANLRSNRPPVVEKYFQGAPHRDPASNKQALAHDLGPAAAWKKDGECIAYPDRQRQTCETDGETDSSAAEQLAQPAARAGGACPEELVNRVAEDDRLIGAPWRPLQMDKQRELCVGREVSAPVHDELLGTRVEIALHEMEMDRWR